MNLPEFPLSDSHVHLSQCTDADSLCADENYRACTCSLSLKELETDLELCRKSSGRIACSFGLHPQFLNFENAGNLEELAEKKLISAVGECGFDFYDKESREFFGEQKRLFDICLSVAERHSLPLVIHDRKAWDIIFEYKKRLAGIPSVVFHSFSFTHREASAILACGINAWFSFGAGLMKKGSRSCDCMRNIDGARILLETDGPFHGVDIRSVVLRAAEERNADALSLAETVQRNYFSVFCAGS